MHYNCNLQIKNHYGLRTEFESLKHIMKLIDGEKLILTLLLFKSET